MISIRQLLAGRDFARDDDLAGQMANYVYALLDDADRAALLVDPAWAPDELLGWLAAEDYRLAGIVLTHYHADHAGGRLGPWPVAGVAELLELAAVPVHVQREELIWLEESTGLPGAAFVTHEAGDALELAGGSVQLLHTPGHTPGSQCLLVAGNLLTGDTLFLDGCGRTDLPGGDPEALHDSLARRIAPLPGETRVLAGHNYSPAPSATLGRLRTSNPVLAPLGEREWLLRFA